MFGRAVGMWNFVVSRWALAAMTDGVAPGGSGRLEMCWVCVFDAVPVVVVSLATTSSSRSEVSSPDLPR